MQEKPRYELRDEIVQFLNHEAEILDNHQVTDWLDLLTDDISYRIPTRVTRERDSNLSEFSDESFHLNEDYMSLEARVERLKSDFAWSENPPSRTRRIVSNVRIEEIDDDELVHRNNIFVFYNRGESTSPDIISAERHDVVRSVDGEFKLADRKVLLDHTAMGISDLSIFI